MVRQTTALCALSMLASALPALSSISIIFGVLSLDRFPFPPSLSLPSLLLSICPSVRPSVRPSVSVCLSDSLSLSLSLSCPCLCQSLWRLGYGLLWRETLGAWVEVSGWCRWCVTNCSCDRRRCQLQAIKALHKHGRSRFDKISWIVVHEGWCSTHTCVVLGSFS